MFRYFFIYKPFGMLSQFTREGDHPTLGDLGFEFPKDIYPVGRLDADSEGLLLLTNDNFLKTKVLDPKNKHSKTYYAQVEGVVTEEACEMLRSGVQISINGKKHLTLPAKVDAIAEPSLPERNPPIRFRQNIPVSWVSISIGEGKNRQVRRMTAAAGFPTLRLVRWSIGKISLADKTGEFPKPGDVWEVTAKDVRGVYD
ncbi:pseudouridine synthase [Dyadobacter fanqingshengii]|uniref:Pseudouridine synthase n=1 Tax=Dyadobacter fanqingshengii TaxID=2906443 RepID=A0A9X1TCG0_9BACT|nr:pseudouridine synthase [Dyadobacter fanqingshengii]MCF0043114.1 pseudouridine synthase [Dyadobacter fanqingshengii]USJ35667.1 pseudouridine synthase [Dyadobacter fanqingshengii]